MNLLPFTVVGKGPITSNATQLNGEPLISCASGARCRVGPILDIVHDQQHFIQFSMSFLIRSQ